MTYVLTGRNLPNLCKTTSPTLRLKSFPQEKSQPLSTRTYNTAMVSLTRSSDNLDLLLYDAAATPLIEPPAPSNASLSEILSELAHLINEREAAKHTPVDDDNNEDEAPQYDPAVIGQLETITSEMQTMNNRLSRAIWQMDNGFDGVGIRMTRLNNRLCAIENGLKSLREEPGGKVLERAAL